MNNIYKVLDKVINSDEDAIETIENKLILCFTFLRRCRRLLSIIGHNLASETSSNHLYSLLLSAFFQSYFEIAMQNIPMADDRNSTYPSSLTRKRRLNPPSIADCCIYFSSKCNYKL